MLYGSALPVRSTVPITAGNVEEELRSFWALSEQRGAGVVLDASAREGTGELTFAGGVLVEPLARGGGRGGDAPSEEMGAAPLPRLEGLLSAGGAPLAAAAGAYAGGAFRGAPVLRGASAELTAGALHRVPLDFFAAAPRTSSWASCLAPLPQSCWTKWRRRRWAAWPQSWSATFATLRTRFQPHS